MTVTCRNSASPLGGCFLTTLLYFASCRCHHCRVCNICVLRMDHHCPWVYNCIGFRNHKYFILLLIYSAIDLIFITVTMFESVWWSTRIDMHSVFLISFLTMPFIFQSQFLCFEKVKSNQLPNKVLIGSFDSSTTSSIYKTEQWHAMAQVVTARFCYLCSGRLNTNPEDHIRAAISFQLFVRIAARM